VRTEDFDYPLPRENIAQEPAARRDDARLFLLERDPRAADAAAGRNAAEASDPAGAGPLEEIPFRRFPEQLRPGDLVVLNDTRVRPVRLRGRKSSGGAVEILLLEPLAPAGTWRAMLSTSKGMHAGTRLAIAAGLDAVVASEPEGGRAVVRLEGPGVESPGIDPIEAHGVMPLPPYIRRDAAGDARDPVDRERYQTVYARQPGAVAAPTAGLHFTAEMLADLPHRGVGVATLSLHVGPGTFLPVRVERIEEHVVEPERYELPAATTEAVKVCRERGGRVVAVGTTVTRVLEARAASGRLEPGGGWCELFIRPGHRFRAVDALLTNLHLPQSSLLILVAAFAGRERILSAYREAVGRGARFYSYGDAMFIRPAGAGTGA
jgi:S-adenosylmethionine:tRNA ribosyltransferase-isomerase